MNDGPAWGTQVTVLGREGGTCSGEVREWDEVGVLLLVEEDVAEPMNVFLPWTGMRSVEWVAR